MLKLTVYIDNTSIVEYDRSRPLPEKQKEYLDRMDSSMDGGISLNGEKIDNPDQNERAKFVALNLIQAIKEENEAVTAASCAYLANRIPDLTEVRADIIGEQFHMDLVFDQGEKVEFFKTLN